MLLYFILVNDLINTIGTFVSHLTSFLLSSHLCVCVNAWVHAHEYFGWHIFHNRYHCYSSLHIWHKCSKYNDACMLSMSWNFYVQNSDRFKLKIITHSVHSFIIKVSHLHEGIHHTIPLLLVLWCFHSLCRWEGWNVSSRVSWTSSTPSFMVVVLPVRYLR